MIGSERTGRECVFQMEGVGDKMEFAGTRFEVAG